MVIADCNNGDGSCSVFSDFRMCTKWSPWLLELSENFKFILSISLVTRFERMEQRKTEAENKRGARCEKKRVSEEITVSSY